MRIAFITQCRPCRELGGSRVQLEIAADWAARGVACELWGPGDLIRAAGGGVGPQAAFEQWLAGPGAQFDVVDYDHSYLLPPRATLPPRVLYVARSVLFLPFVPLLLADDYATLGLKLRARWRALVDGRRGSPQPGAPLHALLAALGRADGLNVSNTRDAALAVALGVPAERILRLPYAVSSERAAALAAAHTGRREPHFVFLGSFDSRKGGLHLPVIFSRLRGRWPDARLTLLGTGQPVDRVLAAFPTHVRAGVRVIERFANDELPKQLGDEAVGLFPSRHEGFPFAVLEQLHAGIPVAAYDAPGACDQLPAGWRVTPSDALALADVAAELLVRLQAGEDLRAQARALAARFEVGALARETEAVYEAWHRLKTSNPDGRTRA